jgi:hypothetical protein
MPRAHPDIGAPYRSTPAEGIQPATPVAMRTWRALCLFCCPTPHLGRWLGAVALP